MLKYQQVLAFNNYEHKFHDLSIKVLWPWGLVLICPWFISMLIYIFGCACWQSWLEYSMHVYLSMRMILPVAVQPVWKGHSKIDKTKVLMTTGSLMKVESIAECSLWSILQNFWPALSDNRSWKQFLVFLKVAVLHRFTVCSILH